MNGTGATGLVDVHAHLVTDEYVAAVRAAGGPASDAPDGMPAWPAWSARDHLDLMDAHGIARSVLSVSSPGVHLGDDGAARDLAAHVDDVAARACRDHPGRFSFFTALPLPDVAGCLAQLRRGVDELGAVGAAVESNAGGAYLGDPAFEPLWDALDARGAVLFVHPTSPPGWERTALGQPRPMLEFLADTTRTVTDLLRARTLVRHPRVRVVVPHCGAFLPVEADRLQPSAARSPRPVPPRRRTRRTWSPSSPASGTTWPASRCPGTPRRWPPWRAPTTCCTAATSASPPRPASRPRSPPSTSGGPR